MLYNASNRGSGSGSIGQTVEADPSAHGLASIPAERSLLWSPSKTRARPAESPTRYQIVIEQPALKEIREHLTSGLDGEVGGLLLGRLFECPDTGRRWVGVDSAFRVGEPLPETAETGELGAVLSPALLRARALHGLPVGWYHSHRRLGVFLSEAEARFHRSVFGEPWHLALVLLADDARPAGGIFQPLDSGELPRGDCVPFYERLVPSSFLSDGRRRTFVGWQNYDTSSTVARAGQDGVSATIPAAERLPPRSPPDPTPPQPRRSEAPESRPVAELPTTEAEEIVFARQVKQTLSAVDVTLGPSLTATPPRTEEDPEEIGSDRVADADEAGSDRPRLEEAGPVSEAPDRPVPAVEWPAKQKQGDEIGRLEPLPYSRPGFLETVPTSFPSIRQSVADLPRRVRVGILASTATVVMLSGGWLLWSTLSREEGPATESPGVQPETGGIDGGPASSPGVSSAEPSGAGPSPAGALGGPASSESGPAGLENGPASSESGAGLESGASQVEAALILAPIELLDPSGAITDPPRAEAPQADSVDASTVGTEIAGTGPRVDAFRTDVDVFQQETAAYGQRLEEFDRGLIGCDSLNSRYRSVDEAFFRLSRSFVKARVELGEDGLQAYLLTGQQMDEVDRHYDGTGCPRPR